MSIKPLLTCSVLGIVLAPALGAAAQNPAATATSPTTATRAPAPVIAQQAHRLLKEVGSYIASAEQFSFHSDINFDHILPSGQKLQFAASEDVVLKRPSGRYMEWNGDLGGWQFWYDGKSVALYDPSQPFYARDAALSDIDTMLDQLVPKLDFASPLADFFYSDPDNRVRRNIQYGFDLGQTDVNGKACRTFAFVEKDIDCQIWIANGTQPTPCKLVITYKNQPAQPQFIAMFSNWNFAPRIADAMFQPELPGRREDPVCHRHSRQCREIWRIGHHII